MWIQSTRPPTWQMDRQMDIGRQQRPCYAEHRTDKNRPQFTQIIVLWLFCDLDRNYETKCHRYFYSLNCIQSWSRESHQTAGDNRIMSGSHWSSHAFSLILLLFAQTMKRSFILCTLTDCLRPYILHMSQSHQCLLLQRLLSAPQNVPILELLVCLPCSCQKVSINITLNFLTCKEITSPKNYD